jgi:hypothetical protein
VHASEVEAEIDSPWRLVMIGALVLVTCDPMVAPTPGPTAPTGAPTDTAVAATGTATVAANGTAARQGFAPTTVGDSWSYRTVQQAPGVAMPGANTTERIVSGGPVSGGWAGRIASEDADNKGANSERSLNVTAAGVSPDIGTMTTSIGPVTTVKTSGVFLPADLTPGLRWAWTQTIDSQLSAMEVAGSAAVVGIEKVTVPAGTFEAVRVRGEIKNHVNVKGGAVAPMDHVQHDESWYVRGLGLVKNVTRLASGYSSEKVLVRYSVAGAPVGGSTAQIATGAP